VPADAERAAVARTASDLDPSLDDGSSNGTRRRAPRVETTPVPVGPAPAAAAAGAVPVRYEARKVHRLIRHVEPWSVLKISLLFYFCLWIIMLVAGMLMWSVASSTGVIDNVEKFIKEIFALKSFSFDGVQIFRAYSVGGLVVVVAATGFTVLLSVLFNLISDLTGGVRVTVVEEETARAVPVRSDGRRRRR